MNRPTSQLHPVTDRVSRRIVIGGTDVTDEVRRSVDEAPPLSAAQLDQLRGLFREHRPAAGRSKHRTRPAALPPTEAA